MCACAFLFSPTPSPLGRGRAERHLQADVEASRRDAELRALRAQNEALARQHVTSQLARLPPAPRDALGASQYRMEQALIVEREQHAAELRRRDDEVAALRAQLHDATMAIGSGGGAGPGVESAQTLLLKEQILALEKDYAASRAEIQRLAREGAHHAQQHALIAAEAQRLHHIVATLPVSEGQAGLAEKQRVLAPAPQVSEHHLRKENALLRDKLHAARAELAAIEGAERAAREARLHTRAEYPGRELDATRLVLGNVQEDVKVLARDNLYLRRRTAGLEMALAETEQALAAEVSGAVRERPRMEQQLAQHDRAMALKYEGEVLGARERETAMAAALAEEKMRVRIRDRFVPVPIAAPVPVPLGIDRVQQRPVPVPFPVPTPHLVVQPAPPARVVVVPVPQQMPRPRPMPLPQPLPAPMPMPTVQPQVRVRYYVRDPVTGAQTPLPGPPPGML